MLAFRGSALPNTLCVDESFEGGVRSATCQDLEAFTIPQPAHAFNATACNWASEDARPAFVRFEGVPQECVARAATPPIAPVDSPTSVALYIGLGVMLGAAVCALLWLGVALWCRCVHSARILLKFVPLRDENEFCLPASTASPPYVDMSTTQALPPSRVDRRNV